MFFYYLLQKNLENPEKQVIFSVSARMAESADATDLKSVIHWVYGFKSRSGYHLLFFRGERKVKQKKAVSLVFFKKESKIKKNIP